MPLYAYVKTELPCANCGASLLEGLDGLVGFQWGYCPASSHVGEKYTIGDPIRWRMDQSGNVPPWTYFKGFNQSGNLGDPSYRNLIVCESEWELTSCSVCNDEFGSIGIEIRDGIITEVRTFPLGDLNRAEIQVIENGKFIPKPEWNDFPMPNEIIGGKITTN